MSIFGHTFRVSTWGESHGLTVGCVVDGVPPGLELTEEDVQPQLDRRRPGQSTLTTARSEADQVTIMSGTENGVTLGTPVAMMVKNKDQRKFDYANTTLIPRPGHADYTYQVKYGIKASSGGGRASARETIGRVAAGAIAEKYLYKEFGCVVVAWVDSIMEIRLPEDIRDGFKSRPPTREEVDAFGIIRQAALEDEVYLIDHQDNVYDGISGNPIIGGGVLVGDLTLTNTHYIRCPHGPTAAQMVARLLQVKGANDSCGGSIGCCITHCPVGLGEPCMDKFEAELAKGMMSLPATKGFEIGSGFDGCRTLRGSRNNDPFESGVDGEGLLHTRTNNHGGTLGGITSGMPIYFRVCIKAASSIGVEQVTADFDGHTQTLAVKGRHDPCVLPRAPPLIESMAAIVTMDMVLRQRARGMPMHTLGTVGEEDK